MSAAGRTVALVAVVSTFGCAAPVALEKGARETVVEFEGAGKGLPSAVRVTFQNPGDSVKEFLEPIPQTTGPWPTYVTPPDGPHSLLVLRFGDGKGETAEYVAMWTADLPEESTQETVPGSKALEIRSGRSWSTTVPLERFRLWGPCGAATDVPSFIGPGDTRLEMTAVLLDSGGSEWESEPRVVRCSVPRLLGSRESSSSSRVDQVDEYVNPSFAPIARRWISSISVEQAIVDIEKPRFYDRLFASIQLARDGPEAKEAVPALRRLLTGAGGPEDRLMAVYVLGAIGPAASDALVDLKTATLDQNERVREVAKRSVLLVSGTQPPDESK